MHLLIVNLNPGLSHHQRSPEAFGMLAEEMHNLKLSQDGGCEDAVFYRTVEGTKWNVESAGSLDQKESSQNDYNCSLSLVGGLQNVIEEIREIIQLALKGSPLVQGMYCLGSRPS
jgi:hypothetical protein